MLGFIRKKQNSTRAYNSDVVRLQGGQSVSPAQMSQLTERGIPISSQLLGAENFDDGVEGPITDVPFVHRRGVDISDIYEYQQRSRSKIQKYVNSIEGQN